MVESWLISLSMWRKLLNQRQWCRLNTLPSAFPLANIAKPFRNLQKPYLFAILKFDKFNQHLFCPNWPHVQYSTQVLSTKFVILETMAVTKASAWDKMVGQDSCFNGCGAETSQLAPCRHMPCSLPWYWWFSCVGQLEGSYASTNDERWCQDCAVSSIVVLALHSFS